MEGKIEDFWKISRLGDDSASSALPQKPEDQRLDNQNPQKCGVGMATTHNPTAWNYRGSLEQRTS